VPLVGREFTMAMCFRRLGLFLLEVSIEYFISLSNQWNVGISICLLLTTYRTHVFRQNPSALAKVQEELDRVLIEFWEEGNHNLLT
jgi:hypothetical protein